MKTVVTIAWYLFFLSLGWLIGEALWGTREEVGTATVILAISAVIVLFANLIHLTSRRHG